MLTQLKTTKLCQIFQVCTQCFNLWTPIRDFPSSDLNTLFIRLHSVVFSLLSDHINFSYQDDCQKEDNSQWPEPTRSTSHQYLQKLQNHSQKYLWYFQKLAEQVNLTYVIIVEDIKKNLEMSSFILVISMLWWKTFRVIWIHMSAVLFVFFLI